MRKLSNFSFLNRAILAIAAVLSLCVPVAAVIVDPRMGTGSQPMPLPEQSPAQVKEQMKSPKVTAPVAPAASMKASEQRDIPKLPHGGDPQAILAVTAEMKQNPRPPAQRPAAESKRSNQMVGLAITAAILGLVCIGAMAAVRKGPKKPVIEVVGPGDR